MLTINQEIKRLEALLNGETVEGLKLNDPGIGYKWVVERIANLRTMQNARTERAQTQALSELHRAHNCDCQGNLMEGKVDPLDALVESILDVALEHGRDDARIIIRDLIYKDAATALNRSC